MQFWSPWSLQWLHLCFLGTPPPGVWVLKQTRSKTMGAGTARNPHTCLVTFIAFSIVQRPKAINHYLGQSAPDEVKGEQWGKEKEDTWGNRSSTALSALVRTLALILSETQTIEFEPEKFHVLLLFEKDHSGCCVEECRWAQVAAGKSWWEQ